MTSINDPTSAVVSDRFPPHEPVTGPLHRTICFHEVDGDVCGAEVHDGRHVDDALNPGGEAVAARRAAENAAWVREQEAARRRR